MNEIKLSDSIIIHAEDEIDSDYIKIIQDIYEKIPLQHGNEKRLFEQFAEYVYLLPKNENNPICESRGRFRFADKRIIIDIPFDMNSRKPGSIFFHEFGHLVADTAGLYRDGLPLGKFKKFCNRLVKECEKYIQMLEKKALENANQYGVAKNERKEYVEKQLPALMKKDIMGYYPDRFLYDYLSDIIDGCTYDRFQLGSGHDPKDGVSYWQNKFNLSNEAFANIFCCKVLGLEEELGAIKRIFPESYQLYEEMVTNIILNPQKNLESWLENKVVLIIITLLSPIVGCILLLRKYLRNN